MVKKRSEKAHTAGALLFGTTCETRSGLICGTHLGELCLKFGRNSLGQICEGEKSSAVSNSAVALLLWLLLLLLLLLLFSICSFCLLACCVVFFVSFSTKTKRRSVWVCVVSWFCFGWFGLCAFVGVTVACLFGFDRGNLVSVSVCLVLLSFCLFWLVLASFFVGVLLVRLVCLFVCLFLFVFLFVCLLVCLFVRSFVCLFVF